MRFTRLRLENFIGIYMGQDKTIIDIDLTGHNTITLLRGDNGSGKSTIMSALSPFAYDGNIDNRASTGIILEGQTGHKYVTIENDGDVYQIHHTYKPTQTSHSVKSHITKNDIDLNPNGNVTSFNEVIASEFHIKESDMRLFRIGTNVNSFVSLSTVERKTYLSGLLKDVDVYLGIFKRASNELRVLKTLIDHCNKNILKLDIADYHQSKKQLKDLERDASKLLKDISKCDIDINKIKDQTPLSITDIITEREHIQADIDFVNNNINMKNITIAKLKSKRQHVEGELQSKTKQYYNLQSTLDANTRTISFCNSELKQYENAGVNTLKQNIDRLEKMLQQYSSYSKMTVDITLSEFDTLMQSLYKIHTTVSQISSYDLWIISNIMDSIDAGAELNEITSERTKNTITPDMKGKIRTLVDTIREDDRYTYPKTDDCSRCIYRVLYDRMEISKDSEEDVWEQIGISDIQRIYTVITDLYAAIKSLNVKKLPRALRDQLDLSIVKQNLRSGISIFNMSDFTSARTTISNYETYIRLSQELSQYTSSYNNISTMNSDKIESLKSTIRGYDEKNAVIRSDISVVTEEMKHLTDEISVIEKDIEAKTKFDSVYKDIGYKEKRYAEISKQYDLYLTSSNRIKDIESDKRDYERDLKDIKFEIDKLSFDLKSYKSYNQELAEYTEKYRIMSLITNATTPKKEKGVPAIYMDMYLNGITEQCNNLLSVAYGDTFKLDRFRVTDASFEIPYIKKGKWVSDVKHASQGELAIVTVALSFVLSSTLMDRYNILLIDEMDSGLDAQHKDIFLDVLKQQLFDIHAEQCFLITHSNSIDGTSVDTIDMSDDLPTLRYATKHKVILD